MTFDEAYEKYKTARNELRVAHGALSKKLNERNDIDRVLPQLIKTYERLHRNLEAAQLALVPELDKEVSAHATPARIGDIVSRVVGAAPEAEIIPPDANDQPADVAEQG